MFTKEDYQKKDEYIWNALDQFPLSKREMLRYFPAMIRRREVPRFLAHYELFKHIIDLPGNVVDLGVFRGGSFFTWTKLMETFCPGDRYRKVYGFDWFEGLQQFNAKDGADDQVADKRKGGYSSDAALAEKLVELHNLDNMLPNIERCVLVQGDVMKTIPEFLEKNPGFRISLLHFDLDLYEPTKFALEQLYPYVVKGGVIAFDEYAIMPWEGETRAVEEFFASHFDEAPTLQKFPFSVQPSAYFIK